jgi:hypothetical protein
MAVTHKGCPFFSFRISELSQGHGCSLRGGISEKDSTPGLQWAYFQGFVPPEPLAEFPIATRKRFAKPLKISSRTLNAIDAVLKRIPVTGY